MERDFLLNELIEKGRITQKDIDEVKLEYQIKKIKEVHPYKIRVVNNSYVTQVKRPNQNRTSISSKNRNTFYNTLFDFYFNSDTIDRLFWERQKYREEHSQVTPKTLSEDIYRYKRWISDYKIANIDIKKIKYTDLQKYFDDIFGKHNPCRKDISGIKCLFNSIYKFANLQDIPVSNPMNQVNFDNYHYRIVDNSDKVYSLKDRKKLIDYIWSIENKDIIDYAILLFFCLTIRVGELKALKWSDIQDGIVHIHGQITTQGYKEYIKGYSLCGFRYIPIPNMGKQVLKELNFVFGKQNEFIFLKKGNFLQTSDVNNRLRKRTKECNIKYYSSHKIRFSNASILIDAGYTLNELQRDMGHASIQMSQHYVREVRKKYANPRYKKIFDAKLKKVENDE